MTNGSIVWLSSSIYIIFCIREIMAIAQNYNSMIFVLIISFVSFYALVGAMPAAPTFSFPRSPSRPVSPLSSCSYVCPIASAAAS
jgi:uncharacterized protein (DUF58 family)